MKYTILKVEKISENGVEARQILTLDVEYGNSSHTSHGKEITLDADPTEEAITFAAELDQVLTEPTVVTIEEVKLKDTAIDVKDISVKVALMKAMPMETLSINKE